MACVKIGCIDERPKFFTELLLTAKNAKINTFEISKVCSNFSHLFDCM